MSQRLKLKDANGKTYVAYKITGQAYETPDLAAADSEGAPRYELEDGRALNHGDDPQEFEIVDTGERLTRVAP